MHWRMASLLIVVLAVLAYVLMQFAQNLIGFKKPIVINSGQCKPGPCSVTYQSDDVEKIAICAIQGRREYMEDRFCLVDSDEKSDRILMFAVYDGHGGSFYSDYAQDHLLTSILRNYKNNPNMSQILVDQIQLLDKTAMHVGGKEKRKCGSTALVGVVHQQRLYVANVGDCRAVAKKSGAKNAVQITSDHKPNADAEHARIKAAGGWIAFKGVWRVGGSLAISRALGDGYLKRNNWLTSMPDIHVIDLNRDPVEYLILASDGLWDVYSSQEAVDFVSPYVNTDKDFGAKRLVESAYKKGSFDNICVIVVKFQ